MIFGCAIRLIECAHGRVNCWVPDTAKSTGKFAHLQFIDGIRSCRGGGGEAIGNAEASMHAGLFYIPLESCSLLLSKDI